MTIPPSLENAPILQKLYPKSGRLSTKKSGDYVNVCEVFFWRYGIPLFTVTYEPFLAGIKGVRDECH
jgi:hypothetical protein